MKTVMGLIMALMGLSACGEQSCPTYNGGGDNQYVFSPTGLKRINFPRGKKSKQNKVKRAEQ
jgi:hypothetical protein